MKRFFAILLILSFSPLARGQWTPDSGKPIVIKAGSHVRTLPHDATAKQILHARVAVQVLDQIDKKKKRPARRLFPGLRHGEVPLIADPGDLFKSLDDTELKGKLASMERYATARIAQHPLSRTYRFAGAPFFNFIPRESLSQKWIVPGGMEGLEGWTNVLLRGKANRVHSWVGHIDPANSISEIVHQRSYRDGAEFADVLFNADGEIFEVRLASKAVGKWDRATAWTDKSRAPAGYVRPRSSECAACHRQAGTGAYEATYVPGGDTVLSEPFAALR